jgi:hypothetical protein
MDVNPKRRIDSGAPAVEGGGSHIVQLGLRRSEAISWTRERRWPRIGPAAYTGRSRLKGCGRAPRELVDSRQRCSLGFVS